MDGCEKYGRVYEVIANSERICQRCNPLRPCNTKRGRRQLSACLGEHQVLLAE
jgi:hypothetical protein